MNQSDYIMPKNVHDLNLNLKPQKHRKRKFNQKFSVSKSNFVTTFRLIKVINVIKNRLIFPTIEKALRHELFFFVSEDEA